MLGRTKELVAFLVMVFVWLVLGMVYSEKFLSPFKFLEPILMPWRGLYAIPEAGVAGRMSFMQGLLEASGRVANAAFVTMVFSFGLLSGYLTLLYQQKQRRVRENYLLLVKNQEIARRNEFIRYISATINHEFKNSLGRIKRRIDLLPAIPPDMRERMDGNMARLFADIEIFKKISDEREASLIDFRRVNLSEMLAALPGQFADIAEIDVRCHSPVSIVASPTLLKTVFENLIDNSIKYRKPSQARAPIHIACYEEMDGRRRYLSISFRDEGVGMDEEFAEECCYKKTGGGGEGWGQGLYFVKYAVGLHAGKVRVGREYTAPGRGTEMIINLPYVEESPDV